MLNILIPMAGRGSRFSAAGYVDPKPFIKIIGTPMIRWVIRNLTPDVDHKFIFVVQAEHNKKYKMDAALSSWAKGSIFVEIPDVTGGAAETAMAALKYIDNSDPLIIANSDQWIEADMSNFVKELLDDDTDGLIMSMTSTDPKWSFTRLDEAGNVLEVAEKKVISNIATVGIYGFKQGTHFTKAAAAMISAEEKSHGEFYVAPVYNRLVQQGMKIKVFSIGEEFNGMHGLGTPEDLEKFINKKASEIAEVYFANT